MKNPSAIWMYEAAMRLLTRRIARRSRMCPPLMATISPRRMDRRAKRPLPSIGLRLITVLGERYEAAMDAAHSCTSGRRSSGEPDGESTDAREQAVRQGCPDDQSGSMTVRRSREGQHAAAARAEYGRLGPRENRDDGHRRRTAP